MAEPETYLLRLRMPLRVVCLLFFIVQLGIVANGPGGYHPPRVEAYWPFLYWFFLLSLPLTTVCLLFIPWTLQIRVTPEGISQSFYVGIGSLKLWEKRYVLRWRDVESVKQITANTLAASSAQSVHFIGSARDRPCSIGITASYAGGYKAALAYALRHARHAHIEESVHKLVAS